MSNDEGRSAMKKALQQRFGSLRAAAKELSINYFRLGTILNGWISPTEKEWADIVGAAKRGSTSRSEKRGGR